MIKIVRAILKILRITFGLPFVGFTELQERTNSYVAVNMMDSRQLLSYRPEEKVRDIATAMFWLDIHRDPDEVFRYWLIKNAFADFVIAETVIDAYTFTHLPFPLIRPELTGSMQIKSPLHVFPVPSNSYMNEPDLRLSGFPVSV